MIATRNKYYDFLENKSQLSTEHGFKTSFTHDKLFDFQNYLVDWAVRKGRGAIFADCGLGKTPMQLVWAENVIRHTNKPVLIVTPLAVSSQTVREGDKFGIECKQSRDGTVHKNITVTNYEQLHRFDSNAFSGVVCDESSAIKNYEGKRQEVVTEFMRKTPFRLLCTATASPNDFIELGTSAEALGELGRMDMLERFFKNDENSLHPIWWGARWRFKAHAEKFFWRWVCSWARACRKPSDLGFSDTKFKLPELIERDHVVKSNRLRKGMLFDVPAETLEEQKEERKSTINERCELVAKLVDTGKPAVVWCHFNQEAELLEKIIPDAKQVSGNDSDEEKEEKFSAFSSGGLRVLVTKPKIGAFGLNWQHCSHMTFFPSHSFEQYYQGVRRCWRFGQKKPVTIDIVTSEGESDVMKNLQRKANQADQLFTQLVAEMVNEMTIKQESNYKAKTEVPSWL